MTEYTCDRCEDLVAALYPNDRFGVLAYPTQLAASETTESAWSVVIRRTMWLCVDELKECVRDCNRPLMWKMLMCLEIENLAIQQKLSASSKSLAQRHRRVVGSGAADISKAGANLKMEQVVLDKMSTVDRIISMIFARMPRFDVPEIRHFEALSQQHLQIRQSWIDEFGELP